MKRSDRYIDEPEVNKYSRVNKNEHILQELEVGIGKEEEFFSRTDKNEHSSIINFSDDINLESYNLKNYIKKAKETLKDNDNSLLENQFSYLEDLNKKYYENYEKEKEKESEEKELFSELMTDDKENIAHDIKKNTNEILEEDGKLINSFYTRSMDLSKDDFVSNNKELEEKPKKNNFLLIFIIFLIIILVIAVLYYTGLLKNLGIKI